MKTYIHYGSKAYNPARFKEIKNRNNPWNKPMHGTGLWASAVDAEYGWKDWCKDEDFGSIIDDEFFEFTLKDDAKKFLDGVNGGDFCMFLEYDFTPTIDFEKLKTIGYDAIEIYAGSSRMLYDIFYGWDCDSILILNKDVIVPV